MRLLFTDFAWSTGGGWPGYFNWEWVGKYRCRYSLNLIPRPGYRFWGHTSYIQGLWVRHKFYVGPLLAFNWDVPDWVRILDMAADQVNRESAF